MNVLSDKGRSRGELLELEPMIVKEVRLSLNRTSRCFARWHGSPNTIARTHCRACTCVSFKTSRMNGMQVGAKEHEVASLEVATSASTRKSRQCIGCVRGLWPLPSLSIPLLRPGWSATSGKAESLVPIQRAAAGVDADELSTRRMGWCTFGDAGAWRGQVRYRGGGACSASICELLRTQPAPLTPRARIAGSLTEVVPVPVEDPPHELGLRPPCPRHGIAQDGSRCSRRTNMRGSTRTRSTGTRAAGSTSPRSRSRTALRSS
ncbi:hypothetical protein C8Q80DRAFT_114609 [Daedaleopsis nitida]|nr:hypothetical protein C8Q80DRAFT_114609 [Daedaleopsis nitida]